MLHWREYGPAAFDLGGARTPEARGEVTVTDPGTLEWISTLERTPGPMTDTWIKWGGKAENYDEETDAPVPSTLPVRSRSTGPWDPRLA
ncbi:hypothetical protein [Yinghuangia soli]|uniref:Uncharacterized protein n=1 Tax=Yinghuangia soli TaxID=2908204 RepID=A0AA41Q8G2_9ACTN|nr:hypothetical protein [Yinghuangia soli]MCF2533530.1 hypothetical protein [Yinghuangia soli]